MDDLLVELQFLHVVQRHERLRDSEIPFQLIHGFHAHDGRADRQAHGVP